MIAVVLFLLLLVLAGYGFYSFFHNAVVAVPKIANDSIPKILDYAKAKGIELPAPDYDLQSLKKTAVDFVQGKIASVGKYAEELVRHFLAFIIGVVIAISLFLNTRLSAAVPAMPSPEQRPA